MWIFKICNCFIFTSRFIKQWKYGPIVFCYCLKSFYSKLFFMHHNLNFKSTFSIRKWIAFFSFIEWFLHSSVISNNLSDMFQIVFLGQACFYLRPVIRVHKNLVILYTRTHWQSEKHALHGSLVCCWIIRWSVGKAHILFSSSFILVSLSYSNSTRKLK